jgi:hypothetical protein
MSAAAARIKSTRLKILDLLSLAGFRDPLPYLTRKYHICT